MPSITATLSDLAALVGRDVQLGEVENLLTLAKAELKIVDRDAGEIKIELSDTNRPDLWSVEGVARQIRTKERGPTPYPFFSQEPDPAHRIVVEPSLESIRPFIAGFLVEGMAVTDESLKGLIEVQEKLCESYGRRRRTIAIGVYNADRIEWPVTYDAVPPTGMSFAPLGFSREMDLEEILDLHPKGVEYRWILDGFKEYPILYDANKLVLSFPPIINSSELGEVKIGDCNLFVEVTGTEIESVLLAINIFAANAADRGGKILPCRVEYAFESPLGSCVVTPQDASSPVDLEPAYLNRLLGTEFETGEIAETLTQYDCRCEISGSRLSVKPPPYRNDYMHPCDVVEDFAIARGFASFPPSMPADFTVGRLHPQTSFEDSVRDLCAGFGFEEVFSNILTSPDAHREKILVDDQGLVEIENYMSTTFSTARRFLFPSLLEVEGVSVKAAFPHRTFEVGETCVLVRPDGKEEAETRVVCSALIADRQAGFSDIQSYMNMLLYYLGVQTTLSAEELAFFISGRSGSVMADDLNVGFIGEVHPDVLAHWGLKTPAALFELDVSLLRSKAGQGA